MHEQKKILIVEDDYLTQKIYRALFSKDYWIQICANDEEMNAALQLAQYDLFIIDLSLQSKKDGIQLIQEIRQIKDYRKTPIMVVTAFAFPKDKTKAKDAGADEVFVKPIDNKVLVEEVKKYL